MKVQPLDKSQVVILTGAFRGIGNILFNHLVSSRVVWPVCRTPEQSEQLSHFVKHTSKMTRWFHGDLCDPQISGKIADECKQQKISPYALIHCVGPIHYSHRPVPDWSVWEQQFHDNVSSAVHLIQNLSGLMNSGRIILFGFSGLDTPRGFKTIAAYAAAKNAIAVLGRSAAKALASKGITVNIISPGVFLTESSQIPVRGGEMLPSIPLGRFGEKRDICGVVDWLLSPASAYVTGQVIKVSGGLHIS